jgi:hypothetical protein
MEISQMLRKVREDVKKITDNRQTPWEYGSLTGDFYFTGPVCPLKNLSLKMFSSN